MSEKLFDGNVASEITLDEAIVRGILNPPKYVPSVFSYQKDLKNMNVIYERTPSRCDFEAKRAYWIL